MKKILLFLMISAIVVPVALATPTPTIKITGTVGSTGGGLFSVQTTANGSFGTFCVETTEYLDYNTPYFYQISSAAKYNNVDNFSDPISLATAYLFANYQTITGTGISTYTGAVAQNDKIQQAIWWFEGESLGVETAYAQAVEGILGASWSSNADGAYGVYVMNLNANDPANFAGRKQDLLVKVPDGGLTVMLLGFGIGAMALVRRKMNL